MLEYARKIYLLRERIDKTEPEIAHLAEMSIAAYFDLEYRDAELLSGPSLRQVVRLAGALEVSPLRLLGSGHLRREAVAPVSFRQLAEAVRVYLDEHELPPAQFAAEIGGPVQNFLENPEMLWEQPVAFIQRLCRPLGIHWLQAIPPDLPE